VKNAQRLHHIRLLVGDMDASIRFYRDTLGFQLKWGEAAIGYASFTGGDLSLFARQGQPEATPMPQAGDRLLSLEVDDLDQEIERLRGQGVEIVAGPRDEPSWGLRVAYIRDPDGNLLELMRQLPPGEWSQWLREADDRYA
jgi:catechol 2,3-dioxygenase-like lactoylglutathione lyase family enzyme